jgi:hypothetical protein
MANYEKLICPLMTAGWLSNDNAAISGGETQNENTFSKDNMVPCNEKMCPLWNEKNDSCNLGSKGN